MDSNEPLRSFTRRQEKRLLEAAASLVREHFGNPDRSGCPNQRTLHSLASRDPSIENDPSLIDHIGTCSTCFSDYSRYRRAYKIRIRLFFAVPAAAFAGALAIWFLLPRSLPPAPPSVEKAELPPTGTPEVAMVLDLRRKANVRGDTPGEMPQSVLRLTRAPLLLSIQLPVGSEDGRYAVQLVNGSRSVLRSSAGQAALQGFIQLLSVRLDCSDLPAGAYTLRVMRDGGAWREFAVQLE